MAAKHKPPIIKLIIIIVPFWWFVTRAKVEWVFVNLCHKTKNSNKKIVWPAIDRNGWCVGVFCGVERFCLSVFVTFGLSLWQRGRSGTEFERVGVER